MEFLVKRTIIANLFVSLAASIVVLPMKFEQRTPTFELAANVKAISKQNPQMLGASSDAGSLVTAANIGGQSYRLLLDTGSNVTWVSHFDQSKSFSFSSSPNTISSIKYADGSSLECTLHTDSFVFGSSIFLANQQFCQANDLSATAMSVDFDGIMGIGPPPLSEQANSTNVFSSLASAGYGVISFWFNTTNAYPLGITRGQIALGGVDSTKYSGQILSVPIAKTQFSRWQVSGEGVATSDGKVVYQFDAGSQLVLDTGTTNMYLPPLAVEAINVGALGAKKGTDGTYTLDCKSIPSSSLSFYVGTLKTPITIPAKLLFIPAQSSASLCKSIIISSDEVQGVSLLGVLFLQNFHLSYDYSNSTVGFASPVQQTGQLVGYLTGPSRPASLDSVAQANAGITSQPSTSSTSSNGSYLFKIALGICLGMLLLLLLVFFFFLWRYPNFRQSVQHILSLVIDSPSSLKKSLFKKDEGYMPPSKSLVLNPEVSKDDDMKQLDMYMHYDTQAAADSDGVCEVVPDVSPKSSEHPPEEDKCSDIVDPVPTTMTMSRKSSTYVNAPDLPLESMISSRPISLLVTSPLASEIQEQGPSSELAVPVRSISPMPRIQSPMPRASSPLIPARSPSIPLPQVPAPQSASLLPPSSDQVEEKISSQTIRPLESTDESLIPNAPALDRPTSIEIVDPVGNLDHVLPPPIAFSNSVQPDDDDENYQFGSLIRKYD